MNEKRDTFSTFHPVINFTFYAGAFLLGMMLIHPVFLLISAVAAMSYYITVKGRKAAGFISGMIPLFLMLSFVNPLFNTYGDRVLFTWWNGRHYTLEALCYGTALAAMVVTILLWFASYSFVMTSDKFLYLFGRAVPSVSLVLTMILRLLPNYEKKIAQISGARKSIGMSAENGTSREKMEHGLTIVSAMTSWALEGGIIMADSMRSRGFGAGKRTTFSLYRFEKRDKCLLVIMAGLFAIVIFCCIMGGSSAEYTPDLSVAMSPYTAVGAVAYGIFLAIPTAVNITEEIIWHILRSKI